MLTTIEKKLVMRAFYKAKRKIIKCVGCKEEILRLTPNHKRCVECAKKIFLQRAKERAKLLPPEINRKRFKDWYYRNIDRERIIRLKRWHNRKKI